MFLTLDECQFITSGIKLNYVESSTIHLLFGKVQVVDLRDLSVCVYLSVFVAQNLHSILRILLPIFQLPALVPNHLAKFILVK